MTKMTRNQHIKPVVNEMIDMKKTNEAENQIYQEQIVYGADLGARPCRTL